MSDGEPCAPLVHAAVRAAAGGKGDFDARAVVALRVAVVVVGVGEAGEVICETARGRCDGLV